MTAKLIVSKRITLYNGKDTNKLENSVQDQIIESKNIFQTIVTLGYVITRLE